MEPKREIPEKVVQVARVCHEANRAYCESIGDFSQPAWVDAPGWQKDSAINGVMFVLDNPDVTPEQSHVDWMAEKVRGGWKFGAVKDPEKRIHPCLVPYDKLPIEQRMKDWIFQGVARAMLFGKVSQE